MQMRNKVMLDYKDNPELRSAFAGKEVGDKCKLEVELQVDELTEEGMVGTIESITPETRNAERGTGNEAETDISPGADEPVLMVIGGKSGVNIRSKKKGKGGY